MKNLNIRVRKLLLKNNFYVVLLIISLIYACLYLSVPKKSIYDGSETDFEGIITNYKIEGDKLSVTVNSNELLKCNYYYKSESEKNRVSSLIKIGSKINFNGELKVPNKNTISNTFNYRDYLYYHNIFYTCNIKSYKVDNSNINFLYKIKNYVIEKIMSYEKVSDYLLTFIIGDKTLLDEDVFNTYRENGVTHLFAISGMHIGLFSSILLFIFKKIKLGDNRSYIITVLFIWFYAFLTGFPSSVLRSGLLFTLLTLNKIYYAEIKTLNILILTGVILIIINPFIVMDIGFMYSYLTTFGLVYAGETIKKHKILGTSLIAFMISLPITINNFYSVNFLSIIFNIFFVPFVSIIVYPLCLLTFIFRFLEPILDIILSIMEYLSSILASISIFKVILPKMSIITIIVYYLVLLMLVNKRFKLCILILFLLLFLDSNKNIFDKCDYVEFLDQTTPNMIQRISGIFERKPLISKEI